MSAAPKNFSQQLDGRHVDADTVVFDVDDGWQQGRGAFGGLIVGAMVRAAITATNDQHGPGHGRHVRSVTAELLGPVVVGPCTLKLERLRQGSGVQAVRVRLLQGVNSSETLDELCQAVVVTGKDRPGTPSWSTLSPPPELGPSMPAWSAIDPAPIGAPVFASHFTFRVTGPLPFGGAPEATAAGFVLPARPHKRVDAAVIAGCADAWWPATSATFSEPRPTATITYALELCCDLDDVDGEVPLFHTARADVACGGYSVEHRQLWTPDGRLVAQNQQLFAIIR